MSTTLPVFQGGLVLSYSKPRSALSAHSRRPSRNSHSNCTLIPWILVITFHFVCVHYNCVFLRMYVYLWVYKASMQGGCTRCGENSMQPEHGCENEKQCNAYQPSFISVAYFSQEVRKNVLKAQGDEHIEILTTTFLQCSNTFDVALKMRNVSACSGTGYRHKPDACVLHPIALFTLS